MDSAITKAIGDYYKLKQKYDDALYRKKSKIMKDDTLSSKEKRKKFRKMKHGCINCKAAGGTIFSSKNGILRAVCGSTTPCSINIEIRRGDHISMRALSDEFAEEVNSLKTQIISTKLDLLFGYVEESVALKRFTHLRTELGKFSQTLLELRKNYLEIVNDTKNQTAIEEAEVSLFVLKERLDELNSLFDETQKPSYITDMIELYVTEISPLVDKTRNMKYKRVTIERDTDNHTEHLIEEPYTVDQLYMAMSNPEPEIISNVM